jgi:hypothetical protein
MVPIKRHTLRINVKGKGYVLYTGDPYSGFEEQPLDVQSHEVSSAYLSLQNRLDQVLQSRRLTWSMSFGRDVGHGNVLVAYGCFVDEADEYGKVGLFFLHALDLADPNLLSKCIESVVLLLSNPGIRGIGDAIGNIAARAGDVNEFLRALSQRVERLISTSMTQDNRPGADGKAVRIGRIEHDCAGAAPLAWLAMAYSHAGTAAPWEVYEVVGVNGNIQTISTDAEKPLMLFASDIQRQGLKKYLTTANTETPTSVGLVCEEANVAETSPLKETQQAAHLAGIEKSRGAPLWANVAMASSLLTLFVVAYLAYDFTAQRKAFLREFNRIIETLEQRPTAAVEPAGLAELSSQGTDQDIEASIGGLFDADRNTRSSALAKLDKWKSDPTVVTRVLEKAQQSKTNKLGILFTLYFLERIEPEQLDQHVERIKPFLSAVRNNGPQTAAEVGKLKIRLHIE